MTTQDNSETEGQLDPKRPALGLCLSGGGFRATLFHLGVFRALLDTENLSRIRTIASVSGGSILAAHLVQHWKDYQSPESFDKQAKEILKLVQIDLRGRITRRYPSMLLARAPMYLFFRVLSLFRPKKVFRLHDDLRDRFSPTGQLTSYYDKFLFKGGKLTDLEPGDDRKPVLHILATNLTKASVCSFGAWGFRSAPDVDIELSRGAHSLRIAEGVAGSSAFPGLFPPLHLYHEKLNWDKSEDLRGDDQYVADGGIYDNIGSRGLQDFEGREGLTHLIVSDAGAKVDYNLQESMRYVASSVLRTVNIIMDVKDGETRDSLTDDSIAGVLSLEDDSTDRERLQTSYLLQNVRTDLDRFSRTEIVCLVQHGYSLALEQLAKDSLLAASFTSELDPSWPLPLISRNPGKKRFNTEKEEKLLAKSHKTRLFGKGAWQDPFGMALLFGTLSIAAQLVIMTWSLLIGLGTENIRVLKTLPYLFNARKITLESVQKPNPELPLQETWEDPNCSEMHIEADKKIFDLSNWRFRPMDQFGSSSKVNMYREVEFIPAPGDQQVRFRTQTSGKDVYLASDLESASFARYKQAVEQRKVRDVRFDIDSLEGSGAKTASYRATYLDSFQNPHQWWVGSEVCGNTDKLSILVRFPAQSANGLDLTPTRLVCSRLIPDPVRSYQNRTSDCTQHLHKGSQPDGGTYLYLEVDNPLVASFYQVFWDWESVRSKKREAENPIRRLADFIARSPIGIRPGDEQDIVSWSLDSSTQGPDYEQFEVLDDTRIVDLRNWSPGGNSEVTTERIVKLYKKSDNEIIRFKTQTSGKEFHIGCDGVKYDCSLVDEPDQNLKSRNILFDINRWKKGEEFELVYRETRVGAFESNEQTYVPLPVDGKPDRTTAILLFPKSHLPESFSCRKVKSIVNETDEPTREANEVSCNELGVSDAGDDYSFVWLQMRGGKIEDRTMYEISWIWPQTQSIASN